jgi:hypothetical protein
MSSTGTAQIFPPTVTEEDKRFDMEFNMIFEDLRHLEMFRTKQASYPYYQNASQSSIKMLSRDDKVRY